MNGTIKKFRRKQQLSVEDLAKKVGVSRMTIHRWEHTKHKPHSNHYAKLENFMKKLNR